MHISRSSRDSSAILPLLLEFTTLLGTVVAYSATWFDIVRVTGHNAVHPGQIDVDDQEVGSTLFTLISVIVEYMVALPNRVNSLYNTLPPRSLAQIQKRDQPGTVQ